MSQAAVLYCPIPTPKRLKLRIKRGIFRFSEIGLEKRCSCCGEYWPYDTEFFYSDRGKNDLNAYCKACYWENHRTRSKK